MANLSMLTLSLLYFISRLPFLRTYPVYYDSFEYLSLAQNIDLNNFSQLISSSHQPIHSFYFITILIFKKILFFLSPNLISTLVSFVFGYLTLILSYLLAKEYLNKKEALFASLLVLVFPYFFVVNTNILYEGEFLFFQIGSLYFAAKGFNTSNIKYILLSGLFFGLAQSIFIGNLSILPIFLLLFFRRKRKPLFFLLFLAVAVITSISIDWAVLKVPSLLLTKYQSHLFDLPSNQDGWLILIFRIVRNILVQTAAIISFSGAILLAIAFILGLTKGKMRFFWTWGIWFIPPFFLMQYWHAGLFGRLSLFLIFPASIILASTFKEQKLRVLTIILIAFTTINYAMKQRGKPPIYTFFSLIEKETQQKPAAIITSDYNRFLYLENNLPTFVFNGKDENIPDAERFILSNLKEGRRVLIDSAGLRFPYYQLDGDFYHILSLGKIGDSQVKKLLGKFDFRLLKTNQTNKEIFFFEIESSTEENKAFQARIFYPEGAQRINSNKTYSSDPLAQFLYLILGKKGPEYWWYDFLTSPTK